jgi:hypothetical protein
MDDKAIEALRAAFHELAQTPGGQRLEATREESYTIANDGDMCHWQTPWRVHGEGYAIGRFQKLAKRAWNLACRIRSETPDDPNPEDFWLTYVREVSQDDVRLIWNEPQPDFNNNYTTWVTLQSIARASKDVMGELASERTIMNLDATPEPVAEPALNGHERAILAQADDVDVAVAEIVQDPRLSAEEKMMGILRQDKRFAGYTSPQWSTILGVSADAIRKTGFWTEMQKSKRTK